MTTVVSTSRILSNATLVTYRLPSRETVEIVARFAVGSAHEGENKSGIAHFVEHLAFQDHGKNEPSGYQEAFSSIGARINGQTGADETVFRVKVLVNHLGEALNTLGQMLSQAEIDQTVFDKEKSVILEEYRDNRGSVMHEGYLSAAFGEHPVARPAIGDEASIKNLESADIAAFRNKHYVTGNLTLLLFGDVDHIDVLALCEAAFKSLPVRSKSDLAPPDYVGGETHFPCKCESGRIYLGFPLKVRDVSGIAASELVKYLVGGHPSSRLFREIRERHALAYDVGCWIETYFSRCLITINADCHADNAIRVFELICKEMVDLRDRLDDAELDRAKKCLISQCLMSLDDSSELAYQLTIDHSVTGQAFDIRELCDAILEIDSAMIRQSIAAMMSENPVLAVHGRMRKMPTLDMYRNLVLERNASQAA